MPILGFNPGVPSNTPGIVTDCDNFIPYEAGMEAAPSAYTVSATVAPAAATGAFTATKLDGTRRVFVGTDTKLYELSSGDWTDVSQSASAYVSGSVWTFCQFGDATLASNYGNTIQASSTSSFSAIVGAPKAEIVESVITGAGGFVFAFNTSDASYGVSPDRWWCSSLNDHTSWTVNAATQATTGRLVGAGGEIVAAKAFGADSIVAYKSNALYHGRYVGGNVVWQWAEVPTVGAAGKRAVCDLGFSHFIVAQDGFWLYDGARPVQVGTAEIRQWFATNVTAAQLSKVEVSYEQDRNRVWIFFPYSGSTTLNKALVYHVGTGQWGLVTVSIETSLVYWPPSTTWGGTATTWAQQAEGWDSPTWNAGARSMGVFNTSHKLVTLTGTPGTSWFQTADHGDPRKSSRVTEAFVEYATRPTTAALRLYTSFGLGGPEIVGSSVTGYDEVGSASTPGRFTARAHGRYHRAEFTFTGACRVVNYHVPFVPAGSR